MDDRQIRVVVDKLIDLMDETGGWCYDTYDTRVGPLYLFLAKNRANPIARYGLFGLYAIELLAPITYRKLRGIPRTWDPMGNSYRAGAEISLYRIDGRKERLIKAQSILDEVVKRAVGTSGKRGFALGFPCITGSNKLWRTDVPVAHYTMRVGRKLLLWDVLVRDGRYSGMLRENIGFLLDGLPWVERDGNVGVAYTPDDPLHVVNIWADVASFLAAYDFHYGNELAAQRARALAASVIAHQNPDGSFPYYAAWENKPGEEDNTHTAMVLGALADVALCYADLRDRIRSVLELGIARWIDMFFDESTGRHWNLVHRPKDAFTVCLGDALYAINRLLRPELGISSEVTVRLRRLERQIVDWSLTHLLTSSGHLCERRLRFKRYTLRSIRSFDGLVCDSLALLIARSELGDAAKLWTQ